MKIFVTWVVMSFFRYLMSYAAGVFLLIPLTRVTLTWTFEHLPRTGSLKLLRQLTALPIIGLLGQERRARRGAPGSMFELFVSQLIAASFISAAFQGLLVTVTLTAVFAITGYWLLL